MLTNLEKYINTVEPRFEITSLVNGKQFYSNPNESSVILISKELLKHFLNFGVRF